MTRGRRFRVVQLPLTVAPPARRRTPRSLAPLIVDILERHGFAWPGGRDNATLCRTYAGRWQRSAGAWSWYLVPIDISNHTLVGAVGGYRPARECIRQGYTPYRDHNGDVVFDR